jgi:hypothetical protein
VCPHTAQAVPSPVKARWKVLMFRLIDPEFAPDWDN